MTVWMDFNPLKYVDIGLQISIGDGLAFGFVWDDDNVGVFFDVHLVFRDSALCFTLYSDFHPARVYPCEDEDEAEGDWSVFEVS